MDLGRLSWAKIAAARRLRDRSSRTGVAANRSIRMTKRPALYTLTYRESRSCRCLRGVRTAARPCLLPEDYFRTRRYGDVLLLWG